MAAIKLALHSRWRAQSAWGAVTTRELRPQFILANDLLKPMEMVVLEGGGQVSVVEQENFLVVLGDASVQERASLLLQQLDKPRPQGHYRLHL
ncbi:MAG: hypothetical protein R3C56_37265 [Pirellulaceae bacterium]